MENIKGNIVIKKFVDNSTNLKHFIGKNEKNKSVKKGEKTVKNLIICVAIKENFADFLFGEAETVENYVLRSVKHKDFNDKILLYYEKVPLKVFLEDSNSFVESGDFTSCFEAIKSMESIVNEGNDKLKIPGNTLRKVFKSNNIVSSLFIDYFYLHYRLEKHFSVNVTCGGWGENNDSRKERFDAIYKFFTKEMTLLGKNLISPKDVREAGLKPRQSQKTENGEIIFCETLSQLYADYIDYLRSKNMFYKKCAACGKMFYADNYRIQYDTECAKEQIKGNHRRSEKKYKSDTVWLICDKERNNYNNFRRRQYYKNAPVSDKKEYDELFAEFKQELKIKKKTFEEIKKGENTKYYSLLEWLNGIRDKNDKVVKKGIIERRKALEEKIKNH